MKRKVNGGKIVMPADANPWPHERRVAKILAQAGYKCRMQPQIKRLLFINKRGEIIDIKALV